MHVGKNSLIILQHPLDRPHYAIVPFVPMGFVLLASCETDRGLDDSDAACLVFNFQFRFASMGFSAVSRGHKGDSPICDIILSFLDVSLNLGDEVVVPIYRCWGRKLGGLQIACWIADTTTCCAFLVYLYAGDTACLTSATRACVSWRVGETD